MRQFWLENGWKDFYILLDLNLICNGKWNCMPPNNIFVHFLFPPSFSQFNLENSFTTTTLPHGSVLPPLKNVDFTVHPMSCLARIKMPPRHIIMFSAGLARFFLSLSLLSFLLYSTEQTPRFCCFLCAGLQGIHTASAWAMDLDLERSLCFMLFCAMHFSEWVHFIFY